MPGISVPATATGQSSAPLPWGEFGTRLVLPASLALVGVSMVAMSATGHGNLAVGAVIPLVVTGLLMSMLPRRLPPLNYLADRDLALVKKETIPLLVYLLIYPLLETVPVISAKLDPISFPWGRTAGPLLSVNVVIGSKVLLLLLPSLVFAWRFGQPLRQLGLRRVTVAWRWVGPIAPSLLLLAALSALTGPSLLNLNPLVLAGLLAVSFAQAGLTEEVAYRCLLQTRFELLMGKWPGVLLSGVISGLRHIPSRFGLVFLGMTSSHGTDFLLAVGAALTYYTASSILYGYMWTKYRNVWANITLHTLFDTLAFASLFT